MPVFSWMQVSVAIAMPGFTPGTFATASPISRMRGHAVVGRRRQSCQRAGRHTPVLRIAGSTVAPVTQRSKRFRHLCVLPRIRA